MEVVPKVLGFDEDDFPLASSSNLKPDHALLEFSLINNHPSSSQVFVIKSTCVKHLIAVSPACGFIKSSDQIKVFSPQRFIKKKFCGYNDLFNVFDYLLTLLNCLACQSDWLMTIVMQILKKIWFAKIFQSIGNAWELNYGFVQKNLWSLVIFGISTNFNRIWQDRQGTDFFSYQGSKNDVI